MKCRWAQSYVSCNDDMMNSHSKNYSGAGSTSNGIYAVVRSPIIIKFEVQLFKVRDDKYVLHLLWLQGPQFLFLDFCTPFLAKIRVL